MVSNYKLGLDLGSVSLNCVIFNDLNALVYKNYSRTSGAPIKTTSSLFRKIMREMGDIQFNGAVVTGSGKDLLANLLQICSINEIVAHSTAAWRLYPDVKYVFEIGGQDSKFISIGKTKKGGRYLKDHAFNELCAAGTGAFLDQQAQRLAISIEELSEMAFKAKNIPHVAGRCSVFAKSDMIHLQQKGVPEDEIVAGLCFSLARNYLASLCKGKIPEPPILFQGGVAANLGVVRAFKEILKLNDEEFIVPEHFDAMGAYGAGIIAGENLLKEPVSLSLLIEKIGLASDFIEISDLQPLKESKEKDDFANLKKQIDFNDLFLGIDVGSVSVKGAVLDSNKNLAVSAYFPTEGKPLEAIEKLLKEIRRRLPEGAVFSKTLATGSGRYLAAAFLKNVQTIDEISAQTIASSHFFPDCDAIIEIGGQDSKFIQTVDGKIVNFKMNRACAAGAGSFLEEQAGRLKIKIKSQFSNLAFLSKHPVRLGDRCTVFMDSDLVHFLQRGAKTEDLCAGLAYATCENYLERVVGSSKIGQNIVFQGGAARNQALKAAFEQLLKKPIKTHPYPEISGAMGAAIFAMKGDNFKNLAAQFDEEVPDLFEIREELLFSSIKVGKGSPFRGEIAIPVALSMADYLPFWATFFNLLGFKTLFSPKTDSEIVKLGLISVPVEFCYPMKILFGHVRYLLENGSKKIFIPHLKLFVPPHETELRHACPYTQSAPFVVKENLTSKAEILTLQFPVKGEEKYWIKTTAKTLKIDRREITKALNEAFEAQKRFRTKSIEEGKKTLKTLQKQNRRGAVLLGRPYNATDRRINLDIAKRTAKLGVVPIPFDFLPLGEEPLPPFWNRIRWGYGRKLVQAARILKKYPFLGAIIITNFGCGPDSFIDQYLEYELSDVSYLLVEFDDHQAETGLVTRLEAFVRNFEINNKKKKIILGESLEKPKTSLKDYTYYLPAFMDHVYAISGALKASGCKAVLLPPTDDESINLGMKHAYGRECAPFVSFLGDLLKAARRPDFIPEKSCYFIPSYFGACLLPQYLLATRLILERIGLRDVVTMNITDENNMKELGPSYMIKMALGIYSIDRFFKWKTEIEPYEEIAGNVDRVYRQIILNIENSLINGNFFKTVKAGTEALKAVKLTSQNGSRPKIGIVGDVYTRSNPRSNDRLYERLKNMGFEVWPSCSMIDVSFLGLEQLHKDFYRQGKKIKSLLARGVVPGIKAARRLIDRNFPKTIRTPQEGDINCVEKSVSRYVDTAIDKALTLNVNRINEFYQAKADGILNVMCHNCMLGNVTAAFTTSMRREMGEIPICTLIYEDLKSTHNQNRLEAFAYQVKNSRFFLL